jgi:hypothetical protein
MDYNELLESFVEVKLAKPDDFLCIAESLTRIGIASHDNTRLYQSCHILSKKSRNAYYIVSYKELMMLDGLEVDFTYNDRARRNTIANLLAQWKLVTLLDPAKSSDPVVPVSKIKILTYRDKVNWELIPKYTIGKRH